MCKILNVLRDNNISLSPYYYGSNDLATNWEIKEIIEHPLFFNSFYINFPLTKVEDIDEYILYLFSLKFKNLGEMIPRLLEDEHKEILSELSAKASNVCEVIEKGAVIKFINSHIEEIFSLEDYVYDIRDTTINMINLYASGINSYVFFYLCENFYWLIIAKFESFYRIFKNEPTLFETLYPSGHLSDLQKRGFKETLDIFSTVLSSENKVLKDLVNYRISQLIVDVEAFATSIVEDNVMLNEGVIREFTSFLQHIRHPRANEFVVIYKKIEEILFNWINKNGSHAEFEIPVEEIIRQFSKTENWIVRLLQLTHSHHSENALTMLKSRLEFDKEGVFQLMDLCGTNLPTDEYFTRSHQMKLSINASVGAGTMIGIMSRPEVYQDYAKLILSAFSFISKQLQREDEHLCDDWELLDQMLQTIFANRELGSESLQPLCYSAAMFTCSLMEKLLRLFYMDRVKGKLYVPVECATLGQLLTETNLEIVDVFGLAHTRHLAFFMLKCGDKKIGRNYRNRLAHWTDMKKSNLSVSFVAELLWLFTDVLNTVFWHYIQLPQYSEEV